MDNDIWEALESTASISKKNYSEPAIASTNDIRNHKNYLMRFLEELDAEITVGEIRSALEDWQP